MTRTDCVGGSVGIQHPRQNSPAQGQAHATKIEVRYSLCGSILQVYIRIPRNASQVRKWLWQNMLSKVRQMNVGYRYSTTMPTTVVLRITPSSPIAKRKGKDYRTVASTFTSRTGLRSVALETFKSKRERCSMP